jgi:hypothetical protein
MAKFRLVLVVLCLGLLGVMPFVVSQPKPETAEPAVQRETAVQRQMAAQRQQVAQSGAPMRDQIGAPLQRVRGLIDAGQYQQAFAILDGLDAVPDITPYERNIVGQMRSYAQVKSSGGPIPQNR